MITYKDCPECGARKIHSTVRLCEVCETCERYESKLEEARVQIARREREHAALLETAQKALAHVAEEMAAMQRRLDAAGSLISQVGCDCPCDHDAESHDEHCERCIQCLLCKLLWPERERGGDHE